MNKDAARYLFTTEGHLIPISRQLTQRPWHDDISADSMSSLEDVKTHRMRQSDNTVSDSRTDNYTANVGGTNRFLVPTDSFANCDVNRRILGKNNQTHNFAIRLNYM